MPLRDLSRVFLLAMVTLAGVFPLLAQNKPGSMAGSPAKVTGETGGNKVQDTAQKTENDSGEGARRDARQSVLRHWVDAFSMALEVAAKLGIVVLIVLVAWYVGHELRRDVLIVDPFSVPERFEKVGLNPRVMANRIGNFLSQMEAETKATSVKKDVLGFSHQEVSLDIEIPGTKLGLKTIIEIVRNVVGRHPKHLSGDFALGVVPEAAEPALIPDSEVTITVYVTQGRNPSRVKSKKVKSSKINELVQCAAEMALEQINPWMFAAYLHDHKNDEAALKILRRMATDTREVLLHRQAALSLWGSILAGQGEPELAIERYKAALELDPKYPIAHMNWANALRRQHKYAEAVEEYKKAIELDPKFASVYGQWGILLTGQEKYDEAIGKYKKAIELDPMNVGAYIMWGEALRAKEEYEEAIEKCKKAIELDPEEEFAYLAWGNVVGSQDKYEEAIQKYEKVIELDPENGLAYVMWGGVFYAQEKYEEAIEKWNRAIELDPKPSVSYPTVTLTLSPPPRTL